MEREKKMSWDKRVKGLKYVHNINGNCEQNILKMLLKDSKRPIDTC